MPEYDEINEYTGNQATYRRWVCRVCGALVQYCGTHNAWHKELGK